MFTNGDVLFESTPLFLFNQHLPCDTSVLKILYFATDIMMHK